MDLPLAHLGSTPMPTEDRDLNGQALGGALLRFQQSWTVTEHLHPWPLTSCCESIYLFWVFINSCWNTRSIWLHLNP